MAILLSDTKEELKEHGTLGFPCGFYELDSYDVFVPWHWHEEFEIGIITKGTAKCMAGQDTYLLREGEGMFINTGVLHTNVLTRTELGSAKADFVFSGRLIYGSNDSQIFSKYIRPIAMSKKLSSIVLRPSIPWQKESLDIINAAMKCFKEKSECYEFRFRSYMSDIMSLIYINCKEDISDENEVSTIEFDRLKLMLHYIETHYNENITLLDISDTANICTREALRYFKDIIEKSPIQYLIQYRILAACEMMKKGTASITDICSACGFTSPSYFSETFKKNMGITPRDYLKTLL